MTKGTSNLEPLIEADFNDLDLKGFITNEPTVNSSTKRASEAIEDDLVELRQVKFRFDVYNAILDLEKSSPCYPIERLSSTIRVYATVIT